MYHILKDVFSLYAAPVSNITIAHHISIHQYADDIQTYIAIQPQSPDSLSQLVNCTDDITHWFLKNGLQLNPSNTEAVVFGTAFQTAKCGHYQRC